MCCYKKSATYKKGVVKFGLMLKSVWKVIFYTCAKFGAFILSLKYTILQLI